MINGFSETAPGVFQSGKPASDGDWTLMSEIAAQKGRKLAVFNMSDIVPDMPAAFNCKLFWFNMPDDSADIGVEVAAKIYKTAGEVASVLYAQNYLLWFYCYAGMNRSTTANAAFMMSYMSLSKEKALAEIRSARPIIKLLPSNEQVLAMQETGCL